MSIVSANLGVVEAFMISYVTANGSKPNESSASCKLSIRDELDPEGEWWAKIHSPFLPHPDDPLVSGRLQPSAFAVTRGGSVAAMAALRSTWSGPYEKKRWPRGSTG